jgi:hypothetical protein
MSQFSCDYNELVALQVEDNEGILVALLDLCKVMIEKDYPLIHDKYGDTLPSLCSQLRKVDYPQEAMELVEKLENSWGEWSEFEG